MAFDAGGSTLVTGSMAFTTMVWDMRDGSLARTFRGHRGTVGAVAFDPDGNVITAGADGQLLRWNRTSGAVLGAFRGHETDPTAIIASPDRSAMITGDWNGACKVWNWETDDVRTIRFSTGWQIPQAYDAAWFPEDSVVVCATDHGVLTSWDRSGRLHSSLDCAPPRAPGRRHTGRVHRRRAGERRAPAVPSG